MNDTLLSDLDVNFGIECFYRIYVKNDFGKLGRSHIESILTETPNVIKNGDFENITNNRPDIWEFFVSYGGFPFIPDPEIVYDGPYGLKIALNEGNFFDNFLKFKLLIDEIIVGKRYQISFWVKHTAKLEKRQGVRLTVNEGSWGDIIFNEKVISGPTDDVDMLEHKMVLIFPQDETVNEYYINFSFVVGDKFTGETIAFWLDNVVLKLVE